MTVTFHNYGDRMFRFVAIQCATDAFEDACDTHDAVHRATGESELVYSYLNVVLTVLPHPAMTWNMVCWMMDLVIDFFTEYEPLALEFQVKVMELRELVALGNITALPVI